MQPVKDLTPTIEFIPPTIDYSTNPDYKRCTVCKEFKHLDKYYFHSRAKGIKFADCMDCQREKDKKEREEYLKENGGSNRIHKYPNQYDDEYQKQQVFQLMIEMGYTFNEEYEIWVKDNVKSIQDGKPYFHFLKYNNKRGRGKKIPQSYKDRIMFYRKKGYSMGKIARITGISDSAICKIIKENGKD